jgi:hypothetical protein
VALRELEKKLDRVFSEYVRLRAADNSGCCQCVTCGKFYYWKNIHCGHFISRSVKAVRFNERNTAPQCARCNSFRQGEWLKFRQWLINAYGKEEVESLEQTALLGGSYDAYQLQVMTDEYREKVKQLKKEKGL